jgi:Zn finger protein HypA/HybF involved in hydrogenase expression
MCVVCMRECVSSPLTPSKRKSVVGCVCMCVVVYESMVRKEERRNPPPIHTLIYTHTPTIAANYRKLRRLLEIRIKLSENCTVEIRDFHRSSPKHRQLQCKKCLHKFTSYKRLYANGTSLPNQCPKCDSRNSVMDLFYQDKPQNLSCDRCGGRTIFRGSVVRHGVLKRVLYCKVCRHSMYWTKHTIEPEAA